MPDATIAHLAVVVATGADGVPVLVLVKLDQPGVERTAVPGIDELRHHARLTLTGAKAELMAEGAAARTALDVLYDRAAVYAAFEQLGGAERCLSMARDYALERKVFGRAIGSYQAIKHKLADVLAG